MTANKKQSKKQRKGIQLGAYLRSNKNILVLSMIGVIFIVFGLWYVLGRGANSVEETCFSETEYCVSGRIREYWEENGGLSVFGFPTSEAQEVDRVTGVAQWFERVHMTHDLSNQPPNDIVLAPLGEKLFTGQEQPSIEKEGCLYIEKTGKNICEPFVGKFRSHGIDADRDGTITLEESIALFGNPLTNAREETIEGITLQVQWFENTRFEYHPANDPPYDILFGLLGNEAQEKDISPYEE